MRVGPAAGNIQFHRIVLTVLGMDAMTKLVLGIAVGLAVALLAGWIWGRSDRSDMARALQTSELRGELLGARAAILDARVAIYNVNFGEASRHLEGALGLLRRADERLKSLGRDDEVRQVQTALASIDDAQRMAGKLDQSANSRAGEAARMDCRRAGRRGEALIQSPRSGFITTVASGNRASARPERGDRGTRTGVRGRQ